MSLAPSFVTQNLAYHGTTVALVTLLRQLPITVGVYSLSGPRRIEISGIEIKGNVSKPWNWLRDGWRLLSELKTISSPLIVWGKEAISTLGWLKTIGLLRNQLIGYWDSLVLPTRKDRFLLKKYDQIITPYSEMVLSLQQLARPSVSCIPHVRPELAANPRFSVSQPGVRFLWLGELNQPHSAKEAIWSFGIYSYTNPNSSLTILGDGDFVQPHRQFDDDILGAENQQIQFDRLIPNGSLNLSHYDVLLITHSSEDYSALLLKAMAEGMAVIAPISPISNRLIQHRVNGLLYTSGDIHQMGRFLWEIDRDRNLLDQLKRGAHSSIKEMSNLGLQRWCHLLGISLEIQTR